jgi:biotin carboxyl carrier protein
MDGTTLSLWRGANRLDFELVDLRRSDFRASAHAGELIARLPGTVVSVEVAVGDHISAGATMMVIEAMKMEHSVVAPYAGRLSAIHYGRGDRVTEGTVLVEVIPAESPAVVNTK